MHVPERKNDSQCIILVPIVCDCEILFNGSQLAKMEKSIPDMSLP